MLAASYMAKILLIDDDESLSAIFSTTLINAGFDVSTAFTGADGLEKAKSEQPTFILLDQVLPDISGNDLLKKLKEEEATKSIPVAMLSNFGQNELIENAIKEGALDYILKYQIEPKDLIDKVQNLLKENQAIKG